MANKLDATNEKIGQKIEREISVRGEAKITKDTKVEPVEGPDFEDVVALEAFMNEPVEVFLYEPMREGEEHIVATWVNGVSQYIIRGRPQTIKRKYVEVLARARKVHVSAKGFKTPDGDAKNQISIVSGLQYPFNVLSDPNPKGPAWLKQILGEEG